MLSQCAAGTMRAHFIDVRFPHEFRAGHVRGAVNAHRSRRGTAFLSARLAEDRRRAAPRFARARRLAHGAPGPPPRTDSGRLSFAKRRVHLLLRSLHGIVRRGCGATCVTSIAGDHVMDYPALSFPTRTCFEGVRRVRRGTGGERVVHRRARSRRREFMGWRRARGAGRFDRRGISRGWPRDRHVVVAGRETQRRGTSEVEGRVRTQGSVRRRRHVE